MNEYSYSVTNNKQIAPVFDCCPVCREEDDVLIAYESWNLNFWCNICGFNGSIEYVKPEEWEPNVKAVSVRSF